MAEPPAVDAVGLTRTYKAGSHEVRGLDGVSLTVAKGQIVAVMGPSGSGKSTLLALLAGLDTPDRGRVRIAGVDWASLRGAERARFRRRAIGYIAQSIALLPQATAAENAEVPLLLDGRSREQRHDTVIAALDRVGLAEHTEKLPDQLSGGEQQRVAIARALINQPTVVLADEPTGNLDSAAAQSVVKLLVEAAAEQSVAVVMVTHDPAVAEHAQRVVSLHSGTLEAGFGKKLLGAAP
jgi:ABC-type lipoprotein export system ATPase subunit